MAWRCSAVYRSFLLPSATCLSAGCSGASVSFEMNLLQLACDLALTWNTFGFAPFSTRYSYTRATRADQYFASIRNDLTFRLCLLHSSFRKGLNFASPFPERGSRWRRRAPAHTLIERNKPSYYALICRQTIEPLSMHLDIIPRLYGMGPAVYLFLRFSAATQVAACFQSCYPAEHS